MPPRYLLVKHSEGWNVDRISTWFEARTDVAHDWCYPASGQSLPEDPRPYDGVIVFGGSNSANDNQDWLTQELSFIERCVRDEVPLFGICLGAQLLARALGAAVAEHEEGLAEVGFHMVHPVAGAEGFLATPLKVMQWHTEGFQVPPDCTLLATGHDGFPNQAFQYTPRCLGVQFHPEVNAAVLAHWHQRNRARRPGQLNDVIRRRQLRDAHEQRGRLDAWLDGFLSDWITHDTR